jgi:hypothetical protein
MSGDDDGHGRERSVLCTTWFVITEDGALAAVVAIVCMQVRQDFL